MATNLILSVDQKLEKLLFFKGCDQRTLNIRKSMWTATLYGLIHCLSLTVAFIIFTPDLTILINYGFFTVIFLTISIIIIPKIHTWFNQYFYFHLTIIMLVTAFVIIKLGGIANSAGLIMACFSFVLSSIPLQNSKIIIALFTTYAIIIFVSGLISPWLIVPDQLTRNINAIVFMINTLSMSAYVFYLILYFIKQQKEFDELETNKLKEINDAKTKFFTGITHEFRTPLTIIKGMTGLIEKNPDQWIEEGTEKIKKNSDILLNLVNQMLDLAKIEAGVMPLHIIQADINLYLRLIVELFKSAAINKKIQLDYESLNKPFFMDFDPDKILHVMSNLISNALKFTPENGKIDITTKYNSEKILMEINVTDNGMGINPKDLPYIFNRFYQVEHELYNNEGTGLGLALAKELVQLMNGNISVNSEENRGSCFIVELPVLKKALIQNELNFEMIQEKITIPHIKNERFIEDFNQKGNKLPTILIVEDNIDVSNYIATILKKEFHIEQAENGKIGVEKAFKLIPDIILSDVMMPIQDGIELLIKVKNDICTSHIPVVLLTAKADITSRIEGLERGADAYLAKPFNEKELQVILHNLIQLRKKLHQRYRSLSDFSFSKSGEFKIEDAFMLKVKQVLEANFEDDEFGISQLCYELAVSRTQLYRKFKSVSNKTITEFFKLIRLQKAKTLLLTTEMNITEIAYATGFKSLSYFSREFAKEHGKSPMEYRKS